MKKNMECLLGRPTNDCVTTLPAGVDGAVRRFGLSYEVRGLMSKLTSYDNAVVGSGSIVNDVALAYNAFGQIVSDAQSHSGAVVPGTTPQVQYAYANGASNTIRPTTLTYPNGRAITIGYGTTGGINDSVSRVDGLIDGATTLVNYAYLGLGVAVQTTYPQPSTQYTLLDSSAGNSPAGDIYWGLDRFGRIIDSRWLNTGTNTDVDRIKYGYDRASNRIWRQNPVATAAGAQFDEFYTNDGLQRLKEMQRGTLNGTNTAIISPTFKQCWTLDATGNWRGFNESTTGSSWTTVQSRTANPVNQITNITNTVGSSWVTPAYDAAGNMTTIPVGQGATAGWAELSTDGWAALNVNDWATLPVSGTTDTYKATYDAWNRLVKIADAGSGQLIQQNQYDARTFRTVILTYTSGVLSETRHSYFTMDWRCIEERVGAATTAERHFVWGTRYIDDLVERDRDTIGGGTLNQRMYAHQDANWNVIAITTTAGAVGERFAYSPYGGPFFLSAAYAVRSNSSYAWETLYCGYRFDAGTNLFTVRNRSFTSILGSWCQRDPLECSKRLSLYEAVASRPLSLSDPLGLFPWLILGSNAAIARPTLPHIGTNAAPPRITIYQPPPIPRPVIIRPAPPVSVPQQQDRRLPFRPSESQPTAPDISDCPGQRNIPRPWKNPSKSTDCSDKQLQQLSQDVDKKCKDGDPGCSTIYSVFWSCADIQKLADTWRDCAAARRKREEECYRGGDADHQHQAALAEYQESYCHYLLRYWECPGYQQAEPTFFTPPIT